MVEPYSSPSPEQGKVQKFTNEAKRHLALLQENPKTPRQVRGRARELLVAIESIPSRYDYLFWDCHAFYCLKYYVGVPWAFLWALVVSSKNEISDGSLMALSIVCVVGFFGTYPLVMKYFKPELAGGEPIGEQFYLSRYKRSLIRKRMQNLANSVYDEKTEYKQPIFQCLSDYDTCKVGGVNSQLACILICSICIASHAIKLFQK